MSRLAGGIGPRAIYPGAPAIMLLLALAGCSGGAVDMPAPAADETPGDESADAAAYVPTAAGAPSTDIYLATLTGSETSLALTAVTNVTDRDGYDNQPAFLPDGSGFLYTGGYDGVQTDVYRYDIEAGVSTRVTDTSSSEFSPTPTPNGGFATIHEAAGVQLLWQFDLDGTERGELLPAIQPVGYQAWGDEDTVAMFVLGDPATLQVGHLSTGTAEIVATDIGRSLHKVPGRNAVSFIDKSAGDVWYVRQLDLETGEITELVQTLAGREDMAWTPDGTMVMGDGSDLYAWRPGGTWWRIADLSSSGAHGITRLAISPNGDRIAIVGERSADE